MKEVVEKCIEDNILRDFLTNNREAVIHMEFYGNEIELRELAARSDGYDDGYEEGLQEGLDEGSFLLLLRQIRSKLANKKPIEVIAKEVEDTSEHIQAIVSLIHSFPDDADPHLIFKEYKKLS